MIRLDDLAGALDTLNPMFLLCDSDGAIMRLGRTLAQLLGPDRIGARLDAVFDLVGRSAPLHRVTAGRRLQVRVISVPGLQLTGVASDVGPWRLFDFSFGLGAVQAVRRFALTNTDFAPTDQTINMLYLAEAKSLALEEFRRLSLRLDGARHAAELQASTDALTGLQNRRGLEVFLSEAAETEAALAVLLIDLDRFKAVNDTLGHAAGDHVLARAAQAMRSEVRASDLLARTGGDEFTLVVSSAPPPHVLCDLAQRIIARIEEPILFEGVECQVSASIGIVRVGPCQGLDTDRLLAQADRALYAAKRAGRGKFVMSDEGDPPPTEPSLAPAGDVAGRA